MTGMSMVSFKLNKAEKRRLNALARAARLSVSAYLRQAALGAPAVAKPPRVVWRRHPVSGLPYDAAPGRRRVTAEEIAAALADYP
jgi:predicted transcriptional regulator